ncbi:hypothetical protein chiPu_0017685 [Chiloscyllium punctatum]|uniref:Uncharacterized protein n=1 Tax=Chiloscyllium punctatum TaxID=137246 RepID=A0A401RI59_CHIPU|nr:hypothetical protein [Chiloscyllium punctatum]
MGDARRRDRERASRRLVIQQVVRLVGPCTPERVGGIRAVPSADGPRVWPVTTDLACEGGGTRGWRSVRCRRPRERGGKRGERGARAHSEARPSARIRLNQVAGKLDEAV